MAVVAIALFLWSLQIGRLAAGSPDNCADIPGMARTHAFLVGIIGAGAIALLRAVVAAMNGRWPSLLASVIVGLALAVGMVVGLNLDSYDPCAPGGSVAPPFAIGLAPASAVVISV